MVHKPARLIIAMPEYAERTSAEDILRTSELAARLLRRLIAPGVIDTQRLYKTYARLTGLIAHAHPLLHDLLARYGVDDDSTLQHLPLVNDQPWMLNVNSYVANNSSFSSTTNTTNNSFFAGTNQFVASVNTTSSTHTELPGTTHQQEPLEKFRVRRGRAGRVAGRRQSVPVDAADDVLNPVPKLAQSSTSPLVHVEAQQHPSANRDDTKSEQEKPASSPVQTLTNLPLVVPTVIQRERLETEIKTSRLVLKDTERIKDERYSGTVDSKEAQQTQQTVFAKTDTSAVTPPTLPLVNRQPEPAQLREIVVNRASENQPPIQLTNFSGSTSSPPTIPLVHEHIPSTQFQTRPPQLVFRKNVDSLTLRDLVSDLSSGSPLATVRKALDSLPQAQPSPSAAVMKPELPSRTDEPPAGEEITTEGMLRRISKMLLIERERRGY
jgi:hypothetical protein